MFNDGDCGFCMRSAAQVHRLGVDVDARTLQTEDLTAHGVDSERALREMAVLDAAGGVHYGHRGWAAILATGPAPWRAVGVLMRHRPVEPIARAVYRWVSENRSRMPGGTPACALPRPTPGRSGTCVPTPDALDTSPQLPSRETTVARAPLRSARRE
jgi:predicted DCC family thiol-disulfide oxidoreductase YuxK